MNRTPSINLPEQVTVWPEGRTPFAKDDDGDFPRLTYYLPSEEYRTGQSVLILPGGGYGSVSSAKEGHRPAQLFSTHGIAAAVLEYRHSPRRHPVPLVDAQRAIRIVRRLAEDHGLDRNRVGSMGFSAGGHLCGLVATQPEVPEGLVGDGLEGVGCRPDFFIMIYAVISLIESCAHTGSRDNLLGAEAPHGLIEQLSVERAVTDGTPPCFLYHGQGDPSVPVDNALLLYRALTRHGVSATMYLDEQQPHGIGLAANHTWGRLLLEWLSDRG